MKIAAFGFAFGVVVSAGFVVPGRADNQPEGLAPFRMVRSLQLVQDRVAAGDHAALPIQRKLLEMIDARMREASAAEMMQPQNFRSMMVYGMSGGNPATLTSVLFRLHLDEKENQIAGAVLAYLKGSAKFAASALKDVEPLKEPADIGAFLALIKGSVISLEDPQNALKFLDQARLLSPGTLVEEAALRRSVGLAVTISDTRRFSLEIDQYVRSYLHSPYASQFADSLVNGIVKLRDTLDLHQVETTVALMSPEQQKVVYLRVARRAAIDGLVELSQFASEHAEAIILPGGSEVDPRILLYTSLTSVTTEPASVLQEKIAKIDRNQLSAGDQELLDAVSAVSSGIISKPEMTASDASRASLHPEDASPEDMPETIDAPAAVTSKRAGLDIPTSEAATNDAGTTDGGLEPPTEQMLADAKASQEAAAAADTLVSQGRKTLADVDKLLAGALE